MLDFLFGEKVVKTTTIKEKTIQTSKRMYSEEDLSKAFEAGHDSARLKGSYKSNGTFRKDFCEWFEKFKKK